jgi:hypothetical protein
LQQQFAWASQNYLAPTRFRVGAFFYTLFFSLAAKILKNDSTLISKRLIKYIY